MKKTPIDDMRAQISAVKYLSQDINQICEKLHQAILNEAKAKILWKFSLPLNKIKAPKNKEASASIHNAITKFSNKKFIRSMVI
jgi:N-methylhydantoinase B/oxoprolinase/acetone carboxylase alpha subunit